MFAFLHTQLLVWEKMHCATCDDPRLLRFTGRPDELSPKARIKMLMGGPAPFDRHDWIVDRCGTEVPESIRGGQKRPAECLFKILIFRA